MEQLNRRTTLIRYTRYFGIVLLTAITYVSLDFLVDFKPASIRDSYRFNLKVIPVDVPQWLRQDNLSILIIKRSEASIKRLRESDEGLQDPQSSESEQPSFAQNSLRSAHSDYFVSYGIGTDFGCLLEQRADYLLSEVCGKARYDFSGRALLANNQFRNLAIPDYSFSENYTILTIKP